ncbi:Phosphate-binding protein PstS precursor [Maioricimonas rarisocia]|uniref:Phosphate-binding protein n=1 Tax=Maioricimonas rarisocia TaxID=2528026 RepID=A0A517Z3Z4_9PLAN|nr:PstS family phosphate ABC transporter substrate-binding protein [Maioricimonas rarisocia]QDU37157.1 Phosphate-binding protein PstS precursor [Maioricimonas rarisocia]
MSRTQSPLWLSVALVAGLLIGCGGGEGGTSNGEGEGAQTASGYMPEGAVAPTPETIEAGEYAPLSRPLFLYVRKEALKKPETVAFLRYYLSEEGQDLVSETGYVRLSSAQLAETTKILEDAIAEAGTPEPGDTITGEVVIDGSSTVSPISSAVSEEFSIKHPDVRVPVGTSGTGGGFKKFLAGETDINDASRPIKESEIEQAQANDIGYIELKIAIDGLTVVVNKDNHWLDGLTVADLRKIWEPNSTVEKWSDVNPEFPDEPIKLFGPDTDSGTFDYFTEVICGEGGASRSDYQQNTDDNFLVTGVSNDENALGYFGFAYYVENQDKVKALAIAP